MAWLLTRSGHCLFKPASGPDQQQIARQSMDQVGHTAVPG